MEKEYLLLIGTIIGFTGSILVSFINNRQQTKRLQITNEHNLCVEELKIAMSIKRNQIEELLPKLEEAAGLVSKLSMEYSMTASYINSLKKISPEEYNEWYLQSNSDLDRLAAIIKINFTELSGQYDELENLTNIFWGNQQTLLYNQENNDKEGCQFFRDKIAADSNKIKLISRTLIDGMSTVANKLNESLPARTAINQGCRR